MLTQHNRSGSVKSQHTSTIGLTPPEVGVAKPDPILVADGVGILRASPQVRSLARLRVVVLNLSLPKRQGIRMHRLLKEWTADLKLAGRSPHTIHNYTRMLKSLLMVEADVDAWDLATVKSWLADSPGVQTARMRSRAARAFLKWAEAEEALECAWWKRIPMPAVEELPQLTATEADYRAALARCQIVRDKALVAVLWSSGLRRAEVARMTLEDLDLDGGHVIIPVSKTKKPRIAPLSPEAVKFLRVYLRRRKLEAGPLWMGERGPLSDEGLKTMLRRLKAPSSHCWRRGWAVDSLKHGISQVSVQSAGGWANGDMVTRYTRALSQELAISEFSRRWA